MSFGQKLQDENTHTLAFGVHFVLLGRAESIMLTELPGKQSNAKITQNVDAFYIHLYINGFILETCHNII